jgi:hypothetical protein
VIATAEAGTTRNLRIARHRRAPGAGGRSRSPTPGAAARPTRVPGRRPPDVGR